MRVLFTFVGGTGHFLPLVPVARAVAAAGHTVAVLAAPRMAATVEAIGLPVLVRGSSPTGPRERTPLRRYSAEREEHDVREHFIRGTATARADRVTQVCEEWRPDLIVCDEVDFSAMIAAERRGTPYASVLVLAAGSFIRKEAYADALDEVRGAYGLPPDPDLAMLSRYLVLSPFPPSFRDPGFPLPPTAHGVRPELPALGTGDATVPSWASVLPGAPAVYFTLGTEFTLECGDLYHRVLAGLRDLPVNLLVTVGRDLDPAEFGPQPPNIRIERYVPQAEILPYCSAVISHGGSGSVNGALAHGLPMLVLPMGADQALNGDRCVAVGAGQFLDAVDATPSMIADALTALLANPTYRRAAGQLRDELAALPEPASAVPLLEQLAAGNQPAPPR